MARLLLISLTVASICVVITRLEARSVNVASAIIALQYRQPISGEIEFGQRVEGRYAAMSKIEPEMGKVVHVLTQEGTNDGCSPAVNVPSLRHGEGGWIALVERGGCAFSHKLMNAVYLQKASAVVVYNNKHEDFLITMNHFVDDVVSVFIDKSSGEHIASLVDSGVDVYMNISIGTITMYKIIPSGKDGSSDRDIDHVPAVGASHGMEKRAGSPAVLGIALTTVSVLAVGLLGLLIFGVIRARRHQLRQAASAHIVFNQAGECAQAKEILLDSGETTSTETSTVN